MAEQVGVIYCGSCGALNPRTNHYCSACGHQLVDAYHPSEGLRVYQTPDPGAALVEIVDPGADITVVDTEEPLPADFAKVLLPDGRIGYVRLREVERAAGEADVAMARGPAATGCISSTAVLAILGLLVITATFVLVTAVRGGSGSNNFIAVLACLTIVPFMLFVGGLYLYMRQREERMLADAEDADDDSEAAPDTRRRPLESGSD